jgi:hypothetical protein
MSEPLEIPAWWTPDFLEKWQAEHPNALTPGFTTLYFGETFWRFEREPRWWMRLWIRLCLFVKAVRHR